MPLFLQYLITSFRGDFDLTVLLKEGDLLVIGVVMATEGLGGAINA
jgi:hypothetical protein